MTADPTAHDLASRQAVVDQILANPPVVHYMSYEDVKAGTQTGVFATEEGCYRFLAERCRPGSRTLETGSGASTILFAACGARHRCVTVLQEEADAIIAYCQDHQIPVDSVTFDIATSDVALTRLDPSEEYDIVLIDGSHGFPIPVIDWYFGAGRLRRGGIVVVDDISLPAVRVLTHFLDSDTRWRSVARSGQWAAYERGSEGSLGEDWYVQSFYRLRGPGMHSIGSVEAKARKVVGPARRWIRRRLPRRS